MDCGRFDAWTRALGGGASRRRALAALPGRGRSTRAARGRAGGGRAARVRGPPAPGSLALLLIGLDVGVAAELPSVVPLPLLAALAGLALVGVLAQALGEVTRGPLLAFAVVASDRSLLGLGPLFWALVLGAGVSLVVEARAVRELQAAARTQR